MNRIMLDGHIVHEGRVSDTWNPELADAADCQHAIQRLLAHANNDSENTHEFRVAITHEPWKDGVGVLVKLTGGDTPKNIGDSKIYDFLLQVWASDKCANSEFKPLSGTYGSAQMYFDSLPHLAAALEKSVAMLAVDQPTILDGIQSSSRGR